MKLFGKIPPRYLIICLGCLIIISLSAFRIFNNFELISYDFRLKLRGPLDVAKDILIIEISDDTLINLEKWPLPRVFHASLIDVLNKYQAKFIIFDVLFSERSVYDGMLAKAISKAKNVYLPLAAYLKQDAYLKYPFPESNRILADITDSLKKYASGTGHINVFTDPDGKVRKIPLFLKQEDKLIPHLGLKVACDWLGINCHNIEIKDNAIFIDKKLSLPYRPFSFFLVNYPGKWGESFLHLSYFQILKAYSQELKELKPDLDLSVIKNKICFIGLTATGTSDLKPTPLENIYPMLGLQASVVNSIIQKDFIKDVGIPLNTVISIIIFSLAIFICIKCLPLKALLLNIILGVAYFLSSVVLLIFYGLWIDLFLPLFIIAFTYISFTLYRFLEAVQQRKLLEKELDIAYTIQKSFLPADIREFSNLDISSFSQPAKFVAGDFYDIFALDDQRLGVFIGDVSGKGVSASLIMAQTISLFRIFARQYSECKQVISQLNDELCVRLQGRFVTSMYLIIDTENNRVRVSSAGQAPLLFIKNKENRVYEKDIAAELPLGIMANLEYKEIEFRMEKGDQIVIFTDGLNEARNRKGQEFGIENVKKVITQTKVTNSQVVTETLKNKVFKFSSSTVQRDDITLIVVTLKK